MNVPSKLILRLSIAYGIMNRDAFEKQISSIIEKYTGEPGDYEKLYDFLFSQLSDLKDYMTVEHIIEKNNRQSQQELLKELKEMKLAIEALSAKIENQKQH